MRSPYAAQYASSTSASSAAAASAVARGHTMSPEGILEEEPSVTVFDRLAAAAQQKAKNEERAIELAKKG
jgi:hypothetical protein